LNEKLLKTNIRQYLIINILLLLQNDRGLFSIQFNPLYLSTSLNSRIIKHLVYFNVKQIFKKTITPNQLILYHIIEIELFSINQIELELHTIKLELLIIMYI